MKQPDDIVQFLRKKDYRVVRQIGQGGFGKTLLLADEAIEEAFVCKKYDPIYSEFAESYFPYFIREIKLLFQLSHRNVVRVFNYYLYPERFTGYILMEYIDGSHIDKYLQENPDQINHVFQQTIEGFQHLESSGILHRDIRPQNIIVDKNNLVKIIDFGFGKQIDVDEENIHKSITANWRYSVPEEFKEHKYDHKTDIYFIGQLFNQIIQENALQTFAFSDLLNRMLPVKPSARIQSFFEVGRMIVERDSMSVVFSDFDRKKYIEFASKLSIVISSIELNSVYISEIDMVLQNLEKIYESSQLEYNIQNTSNIARCFIKGPYRFRKQVDFPVTTLESFILMLRSFGAGKRKIIINHIWSRLDAIDRYDKRFTDELPF